VLPGSPAAVAGLRAGDRLVAADDRGIDGGAALDSFLASRTTGTAVTLTFVREGARAVTTATLTERPSRVWEPAAKQVRETRTGYALQTLTPDVAMGFGLDPETQGAVVTEVGALAPEGIARRVSVDDVIIRVQGRPVASAEQTASALAALSLDGWNAVAVIRPGRVR